MEKKEIRKQIQGAKETVFFRRKEREVGFGMEAD